MMVIYIKNSFHYCLIEQANFEINKQFEIIAFTIDANNQLMAEPNFLYLVTDLK